MVYTCGKGDFLMKKVSELAKELGVSPQSIYKRINKTFKQQLKQHVHKDESGKTLIDSGGEEIIKRSFKRKDDEPFTDTFKEFLMKQVEEKDRQISELMKQNESLTNKLEIMQILLKNEQEKGRMLIEAKEEKQKGFFYRLFKRDSAYDNE